MSNANDDLIMVSYVDDDGRIMVDGIRPSSRLKQLRDLYRMTDDELIRKLNPCQLLFKHIRKIVHNKSSRFFSDDEEENRIVRLAYDDLCTFDLDALLEEYMLGDCLSNMELSSSDDPFTTMWTGITDPIAGMIVEIMFRLFYRSSEPTFVKVILRILREEASYSSVDFINRKDELMIFAKIIKLLIPLIMIKEASKAAEDKYIVDDLIKERINSEDFSNKVRMIVKTWNTIMQASNDKILKYKLNNSYNNLILK